MNREDEIDWTQTTWEGSRAAQLLDWSRLSLLEKFRAVEELEALGLELIARRKAKGLPYFDPDTGEFVPGRKKNAPSKVADPQADYPPSRLAPPNTDSEE